MGHQAPTPQEFWAGSANGKAMLVMLASRGSVELTRDICEWLVGVYQGDLKATAMKAGANEEQAKIIASGGAAEAKSIAEGIKDRNVVPACKRVVDIVFARYYNVSASKYAEAQAWFANELRKRVKNDDQPR